MKKIASVILILLSLTCAKAQVEEPRSRFEVGVAGNMNINSMEFQPSIRQKFLNGWGGGLSLRYTSEKYFSMICATQLEVNFAQRGWEEDFDNGTDNSYRRVIDYVEIPLFAHLAWGKEECGLQFFLNLGPQFGFYLNDKEYYIGDWKIENRPTSLQPIYGKKIENQFDYGIAGGLGVEWKTRGGTFVIEGRYYYALGDIFGNSKTDDFGRSANKTIYARVGYSIRLF